MATLAIPSVRQSVCLSVGRSHLWHLLATLPRAASCFLRKRISLILVRIPPSLANTASHIIFFQRTPCSPAREWGWPRTRATGPSCSPRASPGDSPCCSSIQSRSSVSEKLETNCDVLKIIPSLELEDVKCEMWRCNVIYNSQNYKPLSYCYCNVSNEVPVPTDNFRVENTIW